MWETLYIETPQTSTYCSWRENVNVIFACSRLPRKVITLLLTEKVRMKLNLNYHLSESISCYKLNIPPTLNKKSHIKDQLHLPNTYDQAHIGF